MSFTHILILMKGLLYFVPGLIHSYHPDGGANSIAGFTKYEICEQELLFFFRNIGASQTVHGFSLLLLLYLTISDPNDKSYKLLIRFVLAYSLIEQIYSIFVASITGTVKTSLEWLIVPIIIK